MDSDDIKSKIMNPIFWLKVLAYILKLILEGTSRFAALGMAGAKFKVSTSDIEKHIGDKF